VIYLGRLETPKQVNNERVALIAKFMRLTNRISQLKKKYVGKVPYCKTKITPVSGDCTIESITMQITQAEQVLRELQEGAAT